MKCDHCGTHRSSHSDSYPCPKCGEDAVHRKALATILLFMKHEVEQIDTFITRYKRVWARKRLRNIQEAYRRILAQAPHIIAAERKLSRRNKPCPHCEGQGKVVKAKVIKHPGQKPFHGVKMVACKHCKGKG